MNTRSMSDKANIGEKNKSKADVKSSDISGNTNSPKKFKEGSMAAKANLVRDFNERNNKQ